jgi:hypothetical protein
MIHVSDPQRSVFTSDERLDQTVQQIKSIKKHIPDSNVILMEISTLTPREMHTLYHITDTIYTFHEDPRLQALAYDQNKNKAEVYMIHTIWSFLLPLYPEVTHYAKFGGRYWFSDNVNPNNLFTKKPTMKKVYAQCYRQPIVEPVFYSIPKNKCKDFLTVLDTMAKVMDVSFTDNERLLYDLYAKHTDIHIPEHMDIQGYTATSAIFRYY